VNQGICQSKGPLVFLLNPDSRLCPETIPRLVNFMAENPKAGIVGPKIFKDIERKRILNSCRSFPSFSTAFFNQHSILTRYFPKNPWSSRYLNRSIDRSRSSEVDWVSGSAMLVKRKVFDDVGNLDEGYFLYCEDVDLCLRTRKKGWKIFYCPHAEIIHFIGASSRLRPLKSVFSHHHGMWRYYRKHLHKFILLDAIVFIGITFRCLVMSIIQLFKSLGRRRGGNRL